MHVPGRISCQLAGQTFNLATAYPHGGTALGLLRDVQIRRSEGRFDLIGEEFGQEIIDEVYMAESWVMAFALRGMDDDALGAVFPNTFTGAVTKTKGIAYPGTTRSPGSLRSSSAVRVLFTPDDSENHNAVYFPNAIPQVAEGLSIDFVRATELMIACAFRGLRFNDAQGSLCQIARIKDITL
tara:strand:+ start:71 stop:619 length:549 start_codon:yes stop_codon:yes gene_type:complete